LAGRIAYCIFAAVPGMLEKGEGLVRNASVAATELIREAIIDGRLKPGQRLKEEDLARQLGISRTPVREALLMLQVEGLIVATPNRGATVRVHTPEDLDDLYALRALLEGHAARRAGPRITEEEISLLRESCDRFEALSPDDALRELVRENLFFHSTILDIAGSSRLASMVRGVIELPLVYKSYIWYSPDQKRISSHYHRQIVKALATGDAERAELVMKEHVYEARDVLVARLRDDERQAQAEART
jgi:DNA-binding GntR family transcriptional regulator